MRVGGNVVLLITLGDKTYKDTKATFHGHLN